MEYDFQRERRAGVKQQAPDALCRALITDLDSIEQQDEVPVRVVARTKDYDQRKPAVPSRAQKKTSPRKNAEEHGEGLPRLYELIMFLSEDMVCEQSPQLVRVGGSSPTFDKNWDLV